MKKRFFCLLLSFVMLLSLFSVNTFAAGETRDGPSDKFIELYSEVFAGTESYKVYDNQGNLITDEFVEAHYEDYLNSDFLAIWNSVADNDYLLQYGTPSCQPISGSSRGAVITMVAHSEWIYKLKELKQLVSGKMVEFAYRVIGTYTSNGSTIIAYEQPELDLIVTDPGDLFTYTPSPQFTTTLNSARTQITFNLDLTIRFQYNYATPPYQDIEDLFATAVGEA